MALCLGEIGNLLLCIPVDNEGKRAGFREGTEGVVSGRFPTCSDGIVIAGIRLKAGEGDMVQGYRRINGYNPLISARLPICCIGCICNNPCRRGITHPVHHRRVDRGAGQVRAPAEGTHISRNLSVFHITHAP